MYKWISSYLLHVDIFRNLYSYYKYKVQPFSLSERDINNKLVSRLFF